MMEKTVTAWRHVKHPDTFYVISGSDKTHYDTYDEALEAATTVVTTRNGGGHVIVYESVVRVEKATPPVTITHLR